jgi:hypothetical protein
MVECCTYFEFAPYPLRMVAILKLINTDFMGHAFFGWGFGGQRRKSILSCSWDTLPFLALLWIFLLSRRITACTSGIIYYPGICATCPRRRERFPLSSSSPTSLQTSRHTATARSPGSSVPFSYPGHALTKRLRQFPRVPHRRALPFSYLRVPGHVK